MQDFFYSKNFEDMAREYNNKYGKVEVLSNLHNGEHDFEIEKSCEANDNLQLKEQMDVNNNLENIKNILNSLKSVLKPKFFICLKWQKFCYNKIIELEKLLNNKD